MDPVSARLADFLSPVTRQHRNVLLITAASCVAMSWGGLLPESLNVGFASFKHVNSKILILVVAIIALYQAVSLAVYGWADYLSYRSKQIQIDQDSDTEYKALLERKVARTLTEMDKILLYRYDEHEWLFKSAWPTARSRFVLDLIVPLILGVVALGATGVFLIINL